MAPPPPQTYICDSCMRRKTREEMVQSGGSRFEVCKLCAQFEALSADLQRARGPRDAAALDIARYASTNSILRGAEWGRLLTTFDRADVRVEQLEKEYGKLMIEQAEQAERRQKV